MPAKTWVSIICEYKYYVVFYIKSSLHWIVCFVTALCKNVFPVISFNILVIKFNILVIKFNDPVIKFNISLLWITDHFTIIKKNTGARELKYCSKILRKQWITKEEKKKHTRQEIEHQRKLTIKQCHYSKNKLGLLQQMWFREHRMKGMVSEKKYGGSWPTCQLAQDIINILVTKVFEPE